MWKSKSFPVRCKQAPRQSRQSIHLVGEVPDDGESADSVYQLEYIGTVQHNETTKFFTKLHVLEETGSPTIECQLDTGATCNIMTFDDLCNIKQHGDPLLEPTTALQNIIFDIYMYLTCVHNNLHEVTY